MVNINLFQDNGYINIPDIVRHESFMKVIIGGRGTGKTFGMIDYMVNSKEKTFMLRRTQEIVDTMGVEELSPFKKYSRKSGIDILIKKISKKIYSFTAAGNESYNCLLGAMTTFNNMRGFDADEINVIFYDEFIRILSERKFKGEGVSFLHCIETINRNRELEGCEPVKVVLSGNSDLLDSEILIELGLVNKIIKMRKTGQNIFYDKDRGLLLIVLKDSPISERKKDTALYKLTRGTNFYKTSIENSFVSNELSPVKSYRLKDVRPIVAVEDTICIYEVKGSSKYWISEHLSGSPVKYGKFQRDFYSLSKDFRHIYTTYLQGGVEFEKEYCELIFRNIFTTRKP